MPQNAKPSEATMSGSNSPFGENCTSGTEQHAGSRLSQEQLLRALVDSVPDYLFIKDTEGHFTVANPAVAEDLGCTVAELIGKTDSDLHPPDRAEKFCADEQAVIQSGEPKIDIEEFIITASGQKKWLSTSKLPLRDGHGKISGIVGVCRDITERKRAEDALAESQSRWAFALEGAGQGVWDHNLTTGTAYFSPMWRSMRGIGPDEYVDPSREAWLARVHPDDRRRLTDETDRQNTGELRQNSFEYRERHRDGHYIWILSRGKPTELMPDGTILRIIGTDTDISSLKFAEAKAAEEREQTYRRHLAALEKEQKATDAARRLSESLARHDILTGLPNRRVFSETLEKAISRARRGSVSFSVMIVDLDRFKPINDFNGHATGDEVLRQIARRLGALSRAGDTVARLGGDEFGIILGCVAPELASEAASALAARVVTTIGLPISIGDQTFEVGASIGISKYPDDGVDSDTLLRAADMAMYRAKQEGEGEYSFFEPDMENVLRERMALERDVRRAVLGQDIFPCYQPLMLLSERRLVGFEILARWHHPTRGEVGPDVFIPIVEKLNLISAMTYDLLRRACFDARSWPPEITITLNISPLHLSDPLLPVKLIDILSEAEFPPQRLEIDVTETSLVADIEVARAALSALQNEGIKVSLDDFGSGYSNIYALRDMKFDKIKIDRSFIASIKHNTVSAQIVSSVINLAQSIGLPVLAEGIERQQEVQEIILRGGKYGQGFYFGKAVPAAEAAVMAHGGSAGFQAHSEPPEGE